MPTRVEWTKSEASGVPHMGMLSLRSMQCAQWSGSRRDRARHNTNPYRGCTCERTVEERPNLGNWLLPVPIETPRCRLRLQLHCLLAQDSPMQNCLLGTGALTAPLKKLGFYELRLFERRVNGEPVYFVREAHGWWDDRKRRVVYDQDTLLPTEGFREHGDAEQRRSQERLTLAKKGFIHSLVWHPLVKGLSEYRLISCPL